MLITIFEYSFYAELHEKYLLGKASLMKLAFFMDNVTMNIDTKDNGNMVYVFLLACMHVC